MEYVNITKGFNNDRFGNKYLLILSYTLVGFSSRSTIRVTLLKVIVLNAVSISCFCLLTGVGIGPSVAVFLRIVANTLFYFHQHTLQCISGIKSSLCN